MSPASFGSRPIAWATLARMLRERDRQFLHGAHRLEHVAGLARLIGEAGNRRLAHGADVTQGMLGDPWVDELALERRRGVRRD